MSTYRGITHPSLPGFLVAIWRRLFCPREWHLFDEVHSIEHYLVCDACHLIVDIASIDTGHMARK